MCDYGVDWTVGVGYMCEVSTVNIIMVWELGIGVIML